MINGYLQKIKNSCNREDIKIKTIIQRLYIPLQKHFSILDERDK